MLTPLVGLSSVPSVIAVMVHLKFWPASIAGASSAASSREIWPMGSPFEVLTPIALASYGFDGELLSNVVDVIGASLHDDGRDGFPPHFSGNFWWAHSSYVRDLPDIFGFTTRESPGGAFQRKCG